MDEPFKLVFRAISIVLQGHEKGMFSTIRASATNGAKEGEEPGLGAGFPAPRGFPRSAEVIRSHAHRSLG